MSATEIDRGISQWRRYGGRRWRALSSRDRLALQILALFFALLVVWFGAWQPLRGALQEARANVAAEQQLQRHLRANAPRLAARGHVAAKIKPEELPALLAASAGKHGLEIAQLQQRPDRRLALAINGSPAALIAWLEELQAAGVALAELTLALDADGGWRSDVVLAVPET